jgi:hypothetical protein
MYYTLVVSVSLLPQILTFFGPLGPHLVIRRPIYLLSLSLRCVFHRLVILLLLHIAYRQAFHGASPTS